MIFSILLALTTPPPLCEPPNVLILFDISGTMAEPISKFNQATAAIETVTAARESDIRFGLTVFPQPYDTTTKKGGYCNVSAAPAVTMNTGTAAAIQAYLGSFGGPSRFNDTPIYQTLGAAAVNPALQDATRRNAVILVTDGMQDCFRSGDYNNVPDADASDHLYPAEVLANRADLITQVQRLGALGIPVFVVGLGVDVDPLTLGALAVAAGTQAEAGCNPLETDLLATDLCYFPASNTQEIENALGSIVAQVKQEICNGIDDNCNGVIDEGLDRPCHSCTGAGTQVCVDGVWGTCSSAPATEVCDGVDNDCDGLTDQIPCTSACGPGTFSCDATGQFSTECVPLRAPAELCNGVDDDCNGTIDDGAVCPPGSTCTAGACTAPPTPTPPVTSPPQTQTESLPPAATASSESYLGSGLQRGCRTTTPALIPLIALLFFIRRRR